MKRLHSLLLTALSLLAACDPSPPPSAPGGWQLETSSIRVDPLTGNNTSFPEQSVCGSTPEQLITVHNDESSARQISFAEAAEPFVLTAIQNPSGTRVGLPFAPVTLNPGKSMSFFVKFSPRIPKAHTGFLTVYSDAPLPLQIPLSGKGTGPRLELSVSSLTLSLPTATSDGGVSDDGGTSPSSSATGTIRLTNSGNAPLTSLSPSRVDSSFSVRLSKAVTTAEPLPVSGTVELEVTFNPTSTAGPIITDTLIIASDDPCAPASRIALTGFRTAGPAPVVTPTTLTFAEQEVGTISPPQSVKVFNEGGSVLTVDSLSLLSVADAGTPFVVSPSGAFSLAPGASRDLSVKFSPSTEGHQEATLQLASSGGSIPISLSGDAVRAAPLEVEAASIDFSTQTPGQTQTRTVIVRNPGSNSLTVKPTVASSDKTLNLTVNPEIFTLAAKGDSQALLVTLTPSSSTVPGSWSGQLTLDSGVMTRSSRQTIIPLHGLIVRTPVIPSETSISFNEQVVGAPTQERELVLQNNTALPVTVYKVAADLLGPYSVTGLPVTLPAKGTAKVKVFFNPTSRKQWDVSLQLTSDAVDAIAPVKLSGKAIAPVLSVDSASLALDFGNRVPGTRITKTVTLTNTGDADALVTRIAPMLDSTPFNVEGLNPPRTVTKAGGTISFDVVFTANDQGKKETTLLFYVDHSSTALDSPQVKLSGTSSSPVGGFTPSDTLNFGYRRVGETSPAPMKVTITNGASAYEPLEIVSVSTSTTEFTIVGGSYAGQQVNAGSARDIWINFKPSSMDKASYSDTLVIKYQGTITKVTSTASISLEGTVATAVMSIMDKLPFGAVENNTSKRRQLEITNKGNTKLHLSTISIQGASATAFLLGPLSWPKDIDAGGVEKIDIDFKPTSLDVVSAQVVITSNATGGNVDTSTGKTLVSLSGQGGVASAVFERRSIGFGEVPLGKTVTIGLRISNRGSLPLWIGNPTPSASFTAKPPDTYSWPVSIPAQESLIFPIAFTPTVASDSAVAESLTFTSNDPGEPTVEIKLTGIGIKPTLKVDPSPVEFGENDAGVGDEHKKKSITLTNTAKAPLVITALSIEAPFCIFIPSSSTCVQTLSEAALRELVPPLQYLEHKRLELWVTPKGPGRTEGTLSITANEGLGTTTTEVPLGVGKYEVSIPSTTLDFGTCLMDELSTTRQERSINVSNLGTEADFITDVIFEGLDGSDFEFVKQPSSSPPLPVPAGGLATLNLRFKPKKGAAGLRTATAKIFTEKKGSNSPLLLPLQGVATGEFSGFKDFQWVVDFKTQRLSEKKEPVRFPLQNQLGRPIYVRAYGLEGDQKDDFKLEVDRACHLDSTSKEIEIRVGETCDLLLSYVAQREGLSRTHLVLEAWTRVGAPPIPVMRARLKGEMVSSILAVDPPTVDFDWVDLGQSIEPKLLTVTNRSSAATRVLVPEVAGPEVFTVEALEPGKELPPGGTTQLRVTFQPKMAGEPKGQLLLRLQDDTVTDVTIPLSGYVREIDPEGGGCSSAGRRGPLWAGVLLLLAQGVRRRSRKMSP